MRPSDRGGGRWHSSAATPQPQLARRELAKATPGVAHAMVVSADGLPVAVSERLDRPRADQLAAIASGLASLPQGVPAASKAAWSPRPWSRWNAASCRDLDSNGSCLVAGHNLVQRRHGRLQDDRARRPRQQRPPPVYVPSSRPSSVMGPRQPEEAPRMTTPEDQPAAVRRRVRPYAMTGWRTRQAHADLEIEALVSTTSVGERWPG